MNKMIKIFAALALSVTLAACGSKVEVQPASLGKVMTKDGYRPGTVGTSKFRLDPCIAYCDKLVTLSVADQANTEAMEIFIPQDKLKLRVSIRTNLSIDPKKAEALFNTVPPSASVDERTSEIGRDIIYKTYAQQVILTETREYLSKYSIAEISSSLEKVNADLRVRLQKSLQQPNLPFTVRYVGITDIKYPDIITDAQENSARRREEIQQEEAKLEVSRVALERELQEAQLQRKIDVEKAEADAEADRVRALAITPAVMRLRELENQRAWINQWKGQVPSTVVGDSKGLLLNLPAAPKE